MTKVWRCTLRYVEFDGGVTTVVEYAKTLEDMLILKDQGYDCVPLQETKEE